MYYANDVVEELGKSSKLVIFGAGLVAFEVVNCLMSRPYGFHIDYILVSEKKGNPEQMMGIPLLDLETANDVIKKNVTIIVATMGKYLKTYPDDEAAKREYNTFFNLC